MLSTIELITFAAATCAGLLVGGLYFIGLWWTVNRIPHARQPFNLYVVSLIIRLTVVLAAVYGLLTYSRWPQLVAWLAGFVAARLLLIHHARRALSPAPSHREAV